MQNSPGTGHSINIRWG